MTDIPIGAKTYFATGYGAAVTAGTAVKLNGTTCTPPAAAGQWSVVSSSANDINVSGTGAWTVALSYLDSSYVAHTETLTLNGTTPVNTAGTTCLYPEGMTVTLAGSGGLAAGTLSIYSAVNGGGSLVGTIAISTIQGSGATLWMHHYVPAGVSAYVIEVEGGMGGAEGTIYLTQTPLGVSGAVAAPLGAQIVCSGNNAKSTATYGDNELPVAGPALIQGWADAYASASPNTALGTMTYRQY